MPRKDPEARCEYKRKYREENREKIREYKRKYREENREKIRECSRKYREENREKIRELKSRWHKNNPDKRKASQHARRAKTKVASSETAEYIAVLGRDPCAFCGAPMEHVDHIEPLIAGGSVNCENLTSACAHCNLSKGAKPMLLWLAERDVAS